MQYLAIRYTGRLAANGVVNSVGSRGDSYDNAMAESIFGLYKTEGTVALEIVTPADESWRMIHPLAQNPVPASEFDGFRFPQEIIVLAVRWYLRYGLSYRDVEELLAERGIEADHVTIYRWVQRFTPLLVDAARHCRRPVGNRSYVDETYVKVASRWRYVYRAVDQYGQVIDESVSPRRDTVAARRFFTSAIAAHGEPREVVTDRAPALLGAVDDLLAASHHETEQYANNRIEADHGRQRLAQQMSTRV